MPCALTHPVSTKACKSLVAVLLDTLSNCRYSALLNRLTHKAHILEFVGESYRFRQRAQREAHRKDGERLAVGSAPLS